MIPSSRGGNMLRRAARVGLGFTALAGLAAGALWYRLFRQPLPKTSGTIDLADLAEPVDVRRDRWGVPHVRASTEQDLWFGQGFCHGQDRLFQIDFYRRVASGRLSEIAGAAGLPVDRLMRTLGLRRIAEREADALDPGDRALLERYCAGVNAAASAASTLPLEFQIMRRRFEPWHPADMLTVAKLLAFGLSTNWERELLRAEMVRALGPELAERLEPRYPRGNPVVLRPGEAYQGDGISLADQIGRVKRAIGLAPEASGSNNWAVSGRRSATGAPLLAGDPHLPPGMPGIWYQVGLELSGRWVRGCSLPGLPGVYMGQNNDLAWSFTNAMADVMDLFVERIDGDRYEFEGDWLPLERITEEIVVRGRSEPETLDVLVTRHGPIVNDALGGDAEQPLALRWTALDHPAMVPSSQMGAIWPASGDELVELLSAHTVPVSNLVWADRGGHIGYKLVGRVPVRRGGCPDLPKPGWTGEHEWEGFVPYEELPRIDDPECGYLVTANNRIADDDYPHHITSDYLDGYRARRIEYLIESTEEHDIASFERMQSDLYSIPGVEAAHRLGRLQPDRQREVWAIERLRSWNGRMEPESVAATIYQAFTLRLAREFTRAVIRDRDLSERWLDSASNGFIEHVTSPWRWQARLFELWEEGDAELVGRPWDDLALDALRGALDDLEDRYGIEPEGWRWGIAHEMEFPHAFGDANAVFRRILNRRLQAGGSQETVAQIAYDPNRPYRAVWAPSWRIVADVSDPGASRWQAFTGQSGHPGSRHYDDLMVDWLEGRTQPIAGEGPWRTLRLEPQV
jgi:penicillin amidase